MRDHPTHLCAVVCLCLILSCSIIGILICPVSAADASIEAELGDSINLHGVSYVGDRVFLFLTGPGLPEDGVVLTDISQHADQGKFTLVDVDSNQEWSYKWNTARIENEINPGTYLVYVTNEPVDKTHLGGSSSYKTLEVYLKESTTSRVSVSSGQSYTLNPEMHSSVHAPQLALTSPTPTPTTIPVTTTSSPTLQPTPVPTTRAGMSPFTALVSVLAGGCFITLKGRE